jgi:hypothetical protein
MINAMKEDMIDSKKEKKEEAMPLRLCTFFW